jgi:hypothetical protein
VAYILIKNNNLKRPLLAHRLAMRGIVPYAPGSLMDPTIVNSSAESVHFCPRLLDRLCGANDPRGNINKKILLHSEIYKMNHNPLLL